MFKLNIPLAPLVRILVLAAFLVTAVQTSALAATVEVVNRTGQTILACFHRPSGTSDWNNAYLESRIHAGESHYLNISGNARYVDLNFKLEDGTWRYITNLDSYVNTTLYVD